MAAADDGFMLLTSSWVCELPLQHRTDLANLFAVACREQADASADAAADDSLAALVRVATALLRLPEDAARAAQELQAPSAASGGEGGEDGAEGEQDDWVNLTPPTPTAFRASLEQVPPHELRCGLEALIGGLVAARAYDARARCAMRRVASALEFPLAKLEEAAAASLAEGELPAPPDGADAPDPPGPWRWVKVTAAALGGGAALFYTGGLAAPAISSALPAALSAWGYGGAAATVAASSAEAAVGVAFGAAGAGVTGYRMARRTAALDEFELHTTRTGAGAPLQILVPGWCTSAAAAAEEAEQKAEEEQRATEPDELPDTWLSVSGASWLASPDAAVVGEHATLAWATSTLVEVGDSIRTFAQDKVAEMALKELLLHSSLHAVTAAVAWPVTLLRLSASIDSPFTIVKERAVEAGQLLARAVRAQPRPVTLVGFSFGARVIFHCLEALAAAGAEEGAEECCVEHVVLCGAAISADAAQWRAVRQRVAGRFVNCYSANDWYLRFLYRYSTWEMGVAGLGPIEDDSIENVDVSGIVAGHLNYAEKMGEVVGMVELD